MKDVCPRCSEYRRVSVNVSPTSEKFPHPIWRFSCKVCDHSWVRDENDIEGSKTGRIH